MDAGLSRLRFGHAGICVSTSEDGPCTSGLGMRHAVMQACGRATALERRLAVGTIHRVAGVYRLII